METIHENSLLRQLDLLARAYPGRLTLTLGEACTAVGIKPKTFRTRRAAGNPPFVARQQGGLTVVLVEDVARAVLGLPSIDDDLPASAVVTPTYRRGRPRRSEELEAKRRGITVAELRAQRTAGEAQR